LRLAGKDRGGVHFLKLQAAVGNTAARDKLESFHLSDGVQAAVGFEVAYHDVASLTLEALRFFEHLVGLTYSGSVTKEDGESSARGSGSCAHGETTPAPIPSTVGKMRTSMPSDSI